MMGHVTIIIAMLSLANHASAMQECDDIQWIPDELPGLGEVVDSAAFMIMLSDLSTPSLEQTVLLTIRFAPDLRTRRVDVIGTDAVLETAGAVRTAVESLLHDRDTRDPWGIRLRVTLGESP